MCQPVPQKNSSAMRGSTQKMGAWRLGLQLGTLLAPRRACAWWLQTVRMESGRVCKCRIGCVSSRATGLVQAPTLKSMLSLPTRLVSGEQTEWVWQKRSGARIAPHGSSPLSKHQVFPVICQCWRELNGWHSLRIHRLCSCSYYRFRCRMLISCTQR